MYFRVLVTAILILCITSPLLMAQEKQDPFDLSATEEKIKELGLPTVAKVEALEKKAKVLYNSKKWQEAALALEEYAKKTNWLSNLIEAGLEPYYSADYDDKKEYPYSKLTALVPFEKKVNDYRRKRNRAMVMQAECLINLGQNDKAVSLLVRALDLIDINDEVWWNRARRQLYSIIGIE